MTSDVVSLEMASDGKGMQVKNLSTPITVKIKQPINPFPPSLLISYTHLLMSLSLVDVQDDNDSSVFIEIKNKTEVRFC